MRNEQDQLTPAESNSIRAALDRLVPPVDGLAGAGTMGLAEDVARMAAGHGRFREALTRFLDVLPFGFPALEGDAQDEALRGVEATHPGDFAHVLEAVYIAYYGRPEVHARIGWRTGPLQPTGFPLEPFDEAILNTVRQRTPFWREAPREG